MTDETCGRQLMIGQGMHGHEIRTQEARRWRIVRCCIRKVEEKSGGGGDARLLLRRQCTGDTIMSGLLLIRSHDTYISPYRHNMDVCQHNSILLNGPVSHLCHTKQMIDEEGGGGFGGRTKASQNSGQNSGCSDARRRRSRDHGR